MTSRLANCIATLALFVSTVAHTQPIVLPQRTWVARSLPTDGTAHSGNIKDTRSTYNPDTNLIYIFGGDHSGWSGRTEMYAYSVANDEWILVHGLCFSSGQEQPKGPDEGTFVYDTNRSWLWWVPGFSHNINPDNCASLQNVGGPGYLMTMSFDISTQLWTSSNYAEPPTYGSEIGIYGQYDAVSDSIIRLLGANGTPSVQIYEVANNNWRTKTFGGAAQLGTVMTAFDQTNRKIYAIDPYFDVVWEYDVASESLTQIANVPFTISDFSTEWSGQFSMRIYWDSANELILWPQLNGNEGLIRFHTYQPASNSWELDQVQTTDPPGITVRGNSGTYDPEQNVLFFFGGSGTPNPYYFLYRHGENTNTDTTSPAPPNNLTVT